MVDQYPKEIFLLKIESYLLGSLSKANGTIDYTRLDVIDEIIRLLKVTRMADCAFPLQKVMGDHMPTLGRLR